MTDVFIHPNAICESACVGPGTRIWANAHVLPGARIGADCNICDGVFIENDVRVGDRVTVKCGVQLWDGLVVEEDVFIGPNATFTNDRFPRSKQYPTQFARTTVRRGASIGANATILPNIEVGQNAMIGAGAVVTKSVPANAIVAGNPARIIGYVGARIQSSGLDTSSLDTNDSNISVERLDIGDAALHKMKLVKDLRGDLSVGEFERDIPFSVKRYFLIFNVASPEVRGEHAHKECHQFLVCVRGKCNVLLDDGRGRREIVLDRPNIGVHIPPMIWGTQYKYSSDALLLVFGSHHYDPDDYIRAYQEFQEISERRRGDGA